MKVKFNLDGDYCQRAMGIAFICDKEGGFTGFHIGLWRWVLELGIED